MITKLVHAYTFCTMRCTGDSCCASDFLGRRKAQLLVAEIENCVVFADENVPEDPERAFWWWNIDAGHAEQANHVFVLYDVVVRRQLEGLATEGYFDVWEVGDVFARHRIFRFLQREGLRANHVGNLLDLVCGASQNGGARVEHDPFSRRCVGTNREFVRHRLPVRFGCEVHVVQFAGCISQMQKS